MKQCEGCGKYISDFDRICPHCGHADESMPEEKPAISLEKPAESPDKPVISLEKQAPEAQARETAETEPFRTEARPVQAWQGTNGHPMKWHAFLMVVMIIGAILTVVSGVASISGSTVANLNKNVDVYDELRSYGTFYGIACIAIGVFQFIVRNKLNAFKKDAPRLLLILYAVSFVVNLIYSLGISSAVAKSSEVELVSGSSTTTQLIALVIYAVLNGIYYNKRKDLFVN